MFIPPLFEKNIRKRTVSYYNCIRMISNSCWSCNKEIYTQVKMESQFLKIFNYIIKIQALTEFHMFLTSVIIHKGCIQQTSTSLTNIFKDAWSIVIEQSDFIFSFLHIT